MASKWCGFGAFRGYLILLNVFYIVSTLLVSFLKVIQFFFLFQAVSIFLIALVVIARTFAYQIPSLYVVIGVAVVASILFILAIIGIVAAVRHHQVILFFVSSCTRTLAHCLVYPSIHITSMLGMLESRELKRQLLGY